MKSVTFKNGAIEIAAKPDLVAEAMSKLGPFFKAKL